MPKFNTNEDVGLQSTILQVDANTTIVGESPQYIKNNSTGDFDNVSENDPYWSIKKIIKTGGNKINSRWANGTNRYCHIFTNWASYTY